MALSLPGERPVAAAMPVNPLRALAAAFARLGAARARRAALHDLLGLEPARLHDLGITRADILDAMHQHHARHPGMVLHAARARAARR